MPFNRRSLLGGVAALAIGAPILAACGTDAEPGATPSSPAASGGPEEGAFPVTIAHKFGETAVEAEPKRIACVGLKEQDDLLALGIAPVGAGIWLTELKDGIIGPWAEPALTATGAEMPAALDGANGIPFEQIAALAPDLVLALYAGLTKEDYTKLTEIAPVVAQPKDFVDYGIPWDVEAEIVGRAVGQPKKMAELIAASKKVVTDAAAANSAFKGATSMVVTPYEGIYVYGAQDPRTRLMLDLGFVLPADFDQVLGSTGNTFGGNISAERADIMDVDTLVCFADEGEEQASIQTNLFERLDVDTEGRVIWLRTKDKAYAPFSFLTVLSLPYLFDSFVPRVAAAVDADPKTSTEQAA